MIIAASLLFAFALGSLWGARQEHGNWLNSARVGTSHYGRDGKFYRVEPEGSES